MPKSSHSHNVFNFLLTLLLLVTVQRPTSAQMQPTPSVLLPESYYDGIRTPLEAGHRAPDFKLSLLEDESKHNRSDNRVQLSTHLKNSGANKNRVTLLVFWAFWCDTWRDVTRQFRRLRPNLQSAQAQVLCVAVDASQQPVARRALDAGHLWFPIAIDRRSEVTASYGVRRVPTLFVLDAKGTIRARFEGLPTDRQLLQAIRTARAQRTQ